MPRPLADRAQGCKTAGFAATRRLYVAFISLRYSGSIEATGQEQWQRMDLGFSRWDALRTDAAPAPLDYFRLIASLAAMQAASPTAAAEATLAAGTFAGAHPVEALVRLFEAAPGWVEALAALDGSFHPQLAAQSRDLAA